VAVDVNGASADESPIDYQLDPNGPPQNPHQMMLRVLRVNPA
jgi:hypothetical protein